MLTRIEKIIIGIIIFMILSVVGTTYYLVQVVKDNGGVKQLIIDAGKDIKDISKQINED